MAMIVRQIMSDRQKQFQAKTLGEGKKQVYYLCMEFLMGRSLRTSLFNLGLNEVAEQVLADADIKIDTIYEQEPDAGLGNGGLGRLAACYLDGMATDCIPGTGYSILYEYGIFKQKIVDGWQQETADNWLPGGQVWIKSHPDQAQEIRFDGQAIETWEGGFHHVKYENYNSVIAVPNDMYVAGYGTQGVSKLRLWQAKAPSFDMSSFNAGNYNTAISQSASAELISKILYPNDNHTEGKILRLRQQYFFSAASVADILGNHLNQYGTLENLLPGVYEITEKSVPSPYLMDAEPQLVTLYPNRDHTVYFENHKKPTLTIHKVDSITGSPIKGAKFQVWYGSNDTDTGELNDLGTHFTDEHGEIVLEGLRDGWYKVTELEPAHGFTIKEPVQEVYIEGGESKSLTFENVPLNAIVVHKTDSVTGEALGGATFQLRYLGGASGTGGTVIGQRTTGANGMALWTGLEPGAYIVEEIDPGDGYSIIQSSETVYLADNGEQSVITVT